MIPRSIRVSGDAWHFVAENACMLIVKHVIGYNHASWLSDHVV
jgi:hypothetical protein